MEEALGLGPRRRDADCDWIGGQYRTPVAGPADRTVAARSARRAPFDKLRAGRSHRAAAVLLSRLAPAERVQHRASRRLRHAGGVAGVLRGGPGVSPQTGLHDPERSGLALSRSRSDS